MNDIRVHPPSVPDALIAWTTAAALIAFGIIFFDDAAIMGRTLLMLGIIGAANEALKLGESRSESKAIYRKVRLFLALAYVILVLIGFLFPPASA